MARILLAEDDEIMRVTLGDRLRQNNWIVDEAENGREAVQFLRRNQYQVIVSDIRMPGLDGISLLEEVKRSTPDTDVILMTAYGSVDDAVSCLKKGATDYILKPFDMDDLTIRIKRLLEMQTIKAKCISLSECCRRRHTPIIGSSSKTKELLKLVSQVAMSDSTVLITGESGTGKEVVAAAIHHSSSRADCPYIRINCAAIPAGLMESELFGHEKGAFTGATSRKIGKFELAHTGTILLDEIGEIPLNLQAKLLRVLQEREIERIGATRSISINVRVLCATARNLEEEVHQGTFREDLYYRLQVIPIVVPPLRERREDIIDLCRYFLDEFSKERNLPLQLSDESLKVLEAYDFPGNVRELKNIIERVSVLAPSPVIQPWNLPADLRGSATESAGEEVLTLGEAVARAEKGCIQTALRHTGSNRTEAAELLGISRKNLWEKMKLYQF